MASRRRRAATAHTPLRTSKQDIAAAQRAPLTPQTASHSYRLAYTDEEFLTSEDTRGVRFQLEYLKPELHLKSRGINSTVVLFGGARIPEPGKAAWAARNEVQKRNLEIASKYYDEARRFAQYAWLASEQLGYKDYVVVTGGGAGGRRGGDGDARDDPGRTGAGAGGEGEVCGDGDGEGEMIRADPFGGSDTPVRHGTMYPLARPPLARTLSSRGGFAAEGSPPHENSTSARKPRPFYAGLVTAPVGEIDTVPDFGKFITVQ